MNTLLKYYKKIKLCKGQVCDVVFGFNTFANKAANCIWSCIIIYFLFSSFFNIWDVMNFIISSFFNLISFTICMKLLMAFVIADELVDNCFFFHFSFFLGFLYTQSNLDALVFGLLKLVDGAIPTFVLSSPNIGVYL